MRIVVLGAGRVGAAIVRDLAADERLEVTVVDRSEAALGALAGVPRVTTRVGDAGRPGNVPGLVTGHDLAVNAVPGPIGYATLEAVIGAGVDVVDIAFSEQDTLALDGLAREKGVRAVVDCGVAPGCSNLLLGHAEATFDRVDRFRCMVGGLPVARHWPYEYRAVFSPIDVLAEYTRPARIRRGGRDVVLDALTEVEPVELEGLGTLEAFNSDGLRSLLATSQVPDMVEKTLRYPGHADRMRMLRETGFFSEEPIEVGGATVRPIDVTARLLFPAWQMGEGDQDLTVMRVEVEGVLEGRPVHRRWSLLDRFDAATGTTSMARTTGYTATAAVHALCRGLWSRPGVAPPELLGRERPCFEFVFDYLRERGIEFEPRDV